MEHLAPTTMPGLVGMVVREIHACVHMWDNLFLPRCDADKARRKEDCGAESGLIYWEFIWEPDWDWDRACGHVSEA